MIRIITILAFAILLFQSSILAQASGNYNYNDPLKLNAVSLTKTPASPARPHHNLQVLQIKSLMNVKADSYLAIFHLVQVGATSGEADALLSARINNFLKEIKAFGIGSEDTYTDMLTFVPVYEYEVEKKVFNKHYNEVPKGFEIQKNIHVSFKDPDLLTALVSAAAKNEIYDLAKVEYVVDDIETVYDELRKNCREEAQKRIEELKTFGFRLDTLRPALSDAKGVFYPIERYTSFTSFSSASVDAIKKRNVVNEVKKHQSLIYEKLPYQAFDIIMNAEMLEPEVQFTYSLLLHYDLTSKVAPAPVVKTEVQKEFWLVNPDGELQKLKLN